MSLMHNPETRTAAQVSGLTDSTDAREGRMVWDYFKRRSRGTYVDVGANHPTQGNQTWFLESQGWSGLLVEPHPQMYKLLCAHRPHSRSVQAAVCGPGQEGEIELHLGVHPTKSTVRPECDRLMTGERVRVPARTLNSLLAEAGIGAIDFLSLDVEGVELDALRGLDLGLHRPLLLLIEDHVYRYDKHFYLRRAGYKLVRRSGYNNWYVPRETPISVFTLCTVPEMLRLGRKMWLNTPFNWLRHRLKQRRYARQARRPGGA
jgi:FkbM family methyltransferase